MIKFFYKTSKDKKVTILDKFKNNSWVYVENPTSEDVERLINEFGLDAGLLHDAEDIHEVPRFDIEDNILYVFLRFAYVSNDQIDTTPILLILKDNCIITITQISFQRLELFLSGKIDFSTTHKILLLFRIFSQINETYNQYLKNLTKKLRTFTMRFENVRNRDIVQFVNIENVLYDFNTSLVRMEAVYNSLLTRKIFHLTDVERDLLEDVALACNQLVQITKENLRTIVNIREAYSTILTNNLNRIIKLFTSLTVILTIPTIIGTFYGMNVRLPFSQSPLAFHAIVAITIFIALILVIIFFRKDWL